MKKDKVTAKETTNKSVQKIAGATALTGALSLPDASREDNILSDHFGFVDIAHALENSSYGDPGGCSCSGCSCESDSCACASACGNDSASSGSCGCASCSTPFLYVQEGSEFLMDNDVMFGKPSSLFPDIDSGIRSFKRGEITPDLYLVQKPLQADANGDVKLQIREIEPEVSAIFYTSLKRLSVKSDEEIFVTSSFGGCVRAIADFQNVNQESIRFLDKDGVDLTKILSKNVTNVDNNREKYISLETGDFIDVAFDATDLKDQYLILESWYRDWTLGNVYSKDDSQNFVISPHQKAVKKAQKGLLASTLALCLGYLGFNINSGTDANVLANSFGVHKAHADVPNTSSSSSGRSLEITYRDTATDYKVDVIEPRYARPYAVAIKIPEDSMRGGVCSLRITATKKHRVTHIGVMKGEQIYDTEYEPMSLTKAYHHREKIDYSDILSAKDNSFVKTFPSDILTLQFSPVRRESNAVSVDNIEYKYLFGIGGVYAPATEEDQAVVGNWVPRLDEEAKNFIADVYKESFDSELQFKS